MGRPRTQNVAMINGRITIEQMEWLQQRADELGGNLSAALRQAITDARTLEMARRDFELLSVAVRTPNALVANPAFPPNTVAELIEYLKKNPERVSFASSGTGSSDHLTAATHSLGRGTVQSSQTIEWAPCR